MIIAIIPASKLPGYLVVWRSYSKWRLAIWFGVISKEERSNTRCTRCKRSCQDSESNPNPNPTLGSSTAFLTTWLPWHRWKNWPFIDYMFLYMHVSLHIFEYYCATQPGNLDAGMMAMIISVAFDIWWLWSFFSRGCVAKNDGGGGSSLNYPEVLRQSWISPCRITVSCFYPRRVSICEGSCKGNPAREYTGLRVKPVH